MAAALEQGLRVRGSRCFDERTSYGGGFVADDLTLIASNADVPRQEVLIP